jgi:hypothetical protein
VSGHGTYEPTPPFRPATGIRVNRRAPSGDDQLG